MTKSGQDETSPSPFATVTATGESAALDDDALRARPAEDAAPGARSDDDTLPLLAVSEENYRILGEQGRGGIGLVLRARDRRLGRTVALKRLQKLHGAALERFEREMRITARLQHPGVVPVHEAGCFDNGVPFYSMKLIEGRTLSRCLADAATLAERLTLLPHLIAVAETMAYAHSEGIVHRDLKPGNIIVGAYGEAVVIDWGLAKDLSRADEGTSPAERGQARPGDRDDELTLAGSVSGTPAYMSPEQARGEPVDARADVWALGTVLYQLLTGRLPYEGASTREVLDRVLAGPPAPIGTLVEDVPAELVAIAGRAMAREPGARYPDASALTKDLRRFEAGQLVGAQRYTAAMLWWRWVRRHRAAVVATLLSTLVLSIMAVVSVRNIAAERSEAVRARAAADVRLRSLLHAQGVAVLAADPTKTLGWTREYLLAGGDPQHARSLAAEARARGVARHILDVDFEMAGTSFAPGGARAAIFGTDGSVHVLDVRTAKLRLLGRATQPLISFSAMGPGGTFLTCDESGALLRWQLDGAGGVEISHLCSRHAGVPQLARAGRAVVIAAPDRTLHAIDLETHADTVVSARASDWHALAPDGIHLAAGAGDGVELTDLGTGERHEVRAGKAVDQPQWSSDGARLALVLDDQKIHVFGPDGASLALLDGATAGPLAFSPDGRLLVNGQTGALRLWNLADASRRDFPWSSQTRLANLAFLDENRVLALDSEDQIILLDLRDRRPRPLRAPMRQRGDLVAASDDHVLLTNNGGRQIAIWELDDGAPRVLVPAVAGNRTGVAFAPALGLAGMVGQDGGVLVASPTTFVVRRLGSVPLAPHSPVNSPSSPNPRLAFSADGTLLAVSAGDGTIQVFPVAGGPARVLTGHAGIVYGLAWMGGTHTLASGGDDGSVRLWDADSGAGRVIGTHDEPVRSLAVSRSGRWLATGDKAGGLRLWQLPGATPVRRFAGHTEAVLALQFSPDETLLASGGYDHTVRLWSVAGSAEPRVLRGHDSFVLAVGFSPDGKTLASGGQSASLRLWDVATGAARVLATGGGWISDLDFSARGDRLVVAEYGGADELFDLASGDSRRMLHQGRVMGVRFLPGDEAVVSGGSDLITWPDDAPSQAQTLLRWIDAHTDAKLE